MTEWEEANPDLAYDPDLFRRELLPKLRHVRLADIARAAGCFKAYASDIRSRRYMPHVSAWQALAAIVDLGLSAATSGER